jgi:DNA-binding SARP family transcriptional activator/pimeloyl-ACP methyl ester carboxylesterase
MVRASETAAAAGPNAITLLGGFAVTIAGRPVDPTHWRRRPAASLVKLLALATDRRLHREQVIDALWPDVPVTDAAPRLHKAAHFARRAMGVDAIVSTGESVQLLPGRQVSIDVGEFETAAAAALDSGAGLEAAIARYHGELLPEDRYAPWTEERRVALAHVHRQLLRAAGRWSELLADDPTDEGAHAALIRAHVERGDRAAALAQYDRLAAILDAELGVRPGVESAAVRDAALALPIGNPPAASRVLPDQEIRFCHAADGARLAYALAGSGRPLVKAANWLSHLEYDWESLIWRHWLVELTSRFRLLRYDERGCGLSDWDVASFGLDAWVEDLATVVDAAGFGRFPLLGVSQGAAVAVEYAAANPERVSALVLYGGYVHGPVKRAPSGDAARAARILPELAELGWGNDEPSFRQVFTARFVPGGTRAQWDEFNELQRRSTSATNAARFMRAFAEIDVTEAAGRVTCPTLVVHLRGDRSPPVAEGRLLASLIPGSRFVSLEGDNHLMLDTDDAWPRFVAEVARFLATAG